MLNNIKQYVKTAFFACFTLLFVLIIKLVLFNNASPYYEPGMRGLILCFLAWSVVFTLIWFVIKKLNQSINSKISAGVLLAAYFIVLVVFGMILERAPNMGWDFPTVQLEAEQYVLYGTAPSEYFAIYENNAPLFTVFVLFFKGLKILGINSFMRPLIILNCLCIALTAYLVYKISGKMYSNDKALFALILFMSCPAFVLYTPIVYTDTLTMPFVTGAVLYLIKAKSALKEENTKSFAVFFAIAMLLCSIGTTLKISVGIVAIAAVIDLIFTKEKKPFVIIGISLMCMIALVIGGNYYSKQMVGHQDRERIPFTHWIMMGLQGYGSYNDDDYKMVLEYDTYEERSEFIRSEIIRRINEKGISGMNEHLQGKLSFMFSDGTYFASDKLDRAPLNSTHWIYDFVVRTGQHSKAFYYISDGWQLMFLVMIATSSLVSITKSQENDFLLRMAVFGIILFLLMWENRSRYLVNFLPVMTLCAIINSRQAKNS